MKNFVSLEKKDTFALIVLSRNLLFENFYKILNPKLNDNEEEITVPCDVCFPDNECCLG